MTYAHVCCHCCGCCTGAFYATNNMPRKAKSPLEFKLDGAFPMSGQAANDQPPCYPIEVQCDDGCELNDLLTEYYGEPIWLCSSA
jgi:hypothetical protein